MNETSSPEFTQLTDLAAERLGGKVLACSDDFFAEKENLIKPGRGIFIPDKYTDRGKWMDGWESRRKRSPGHDWCIVQLATTGIIRGVDIDTNHFLGNHPPFASIEATNIREDITDFEKIVWQEILPKSPLQPGDHNYFEIGLAVSDIRQAAQKRPDGFSHIKLHIYPDGGVARLKVYGEVIKDWKSVTEDETIDLASALNGARAIACNDMFFSHMENLIMPGRGVNMGDGWETKRNRNAGNKDWIIVRLAHEGVIEKILIDTHHFKGNYPDSCFIEGCNISLKDENKLLNNEIAWETILPQSKLDADLESYFEREIITNEPFTHVRLSIIPDGGVSRMRLWGRITQ
jgi:allantoicase